MFVTVNVAYKGQTPVEFTLTDGDLTLKAFLRLLAHSTRTAPEDLSTYTISFLDDDGDWCTIAKNEDVVEAFKVATLDVARTMQLRIQATTAVTTDAAVLSAPPATAAAAAAAAAAVGSPVAAGVAPPTPPPTAAVIATPAPPAECEGWDNRLEFVLNGEKIVVENPDPTMLLADYLRNVAMLRGTKIACGEGGCGACTVVLSKLDRASGVVSHEPINSCMHPLCSLNGVGVTTVEGIGNQRKGFHAIQKAMAAGNASQCGFCSPGWVVAMYALMCQDSKPSAQKVENWFDGNLCRCTGYRPILETFKAFAAGDAGAVDVHEDHGHDHDHDHSHESKAGGCSGSGACGGKGSCHRAGADGAAGVDMEDLCGSSTTASVIPPGLDPTEVLKKFELRPIFFEGPRLPGGRMHFLRPVSLEQLLALRRHYMRAPVGTVKYLVGNTASGVLKYYIKSSPVRVFIDLSAVPELQRTAANEAGATVGGAVSIQRMIDFLGQVDPTAPTTTNDPARLPKDTTWPTSFAALNAHLVHVANNQVRTAGSWAGNLIMAANLHVFPSDLYLMFVTLGCTVNVVKGDRLLHAVPVQDLYSQCRPGSIDVLLLSVHIPKIVARPANSARWCAMDSFKIELRAQNSKPIVNAGFRVEFEKVQQTGYEVITSATVVYGGVGAELFRATEVEAALLGAKLDDDVIQRAMVAVNAGVDRVGDCQDPSQTTAYRRRLAAGLLYKFFLRCVPVALPPQLQSAAAQPLRPVSSGTQTYAVDPSEGPVDEPVVKLTALQQTSGEAVYCMDIAMPKNGLFGAFAFTTVANATLVSVDTTEAEKMPGVVRVFTAKDIPGTNWVGLNPEEEHLFIPEGSPVTSKELPIAFVVADTFVRARAAADLVKSTYSGVADPIIGIPEALAKNSTFPGTPSNPLMNNITRGNPDDALKAAPHTAQGVVSTGGQRHFYMETQNVLAFPDEDYVLQVHASSQLLDGVQSAVMAVTGYTAKQVNVKLRRAGGAFGGKISRPFQLAGASALGAMLLGRPVHAMYDREQDTRACGGREPFIGSYEVGFDDEGLISALKMNFYIDSGYIIDTTFGDAGMAQLWADNAYFVPNYESNITVLKTNMPTTTSMRAPGVVQAVLITESAVDHVARALNLPPDVVRERNFYRQGQLTPYGQRLQYVSLPSVWHKLKEVAQYDEAVAAAQAFNAANRFTKRGVAITPIKYGVTGPEYAEGANISVFPTDGTVVIAHSGVEIGQGINTKVAQAAAYALGIPLDMIRIRDAATDSIPNGSGTGGSGTSEICVSAVLDACKNLMARLSQFKTPTAGTWMDMVNGASNAGLSLNAQGWHTLVNPPVTQSFQYFVYAAAMSVVEIDVITGQLQIIKSHIYYDCGISLNPDIDIGQVEGAYIMGVGYFTTEQVLYDQSGTLLTQGTWSYKPPCTLDIPQVLNVSLLKNAPNPVGVLRSKATGEPPYALANSVYFAVRDAVSAARTQAGNTDFFELPVPCTLDVIADACATTADMFKLEL